MIDISSFWKKQNKTQQLKDGFKKKIFFSYI